MLIGRGAGQDATASAVISDIVDAVTSISSRFQKVVLNEAAFYERLSDGSTIAGLDRFKVSIYAFQSMTNQAYSPVLQKSSQMLESAYQPLIKLRGRGRA